MESRSVFFVAQINLLKFNIDTQNDAILERTVTFFLAHHFILVSMLVFPIGKKNGAWKTFSFPIGTR